MTRRPLLMLVTEPHPRLAEIVEEAIAGGVDAVQWRGVAPLRPIPRSFQSGRRHPSQGRLLASPSPTSCFAGGRGVQESQPQRGSQGSPPQPSPKERESELGDNNASISYLKPLSFGEGLGRGAIKHRTNPFPVGEGEDAVAAGGEVSHLINSPSLITLPPGADGIHLPERAGNVSDAREKYGAGILIGRSIHSVDAARRAEAVGADYVIAGTIFTSNSHPGEPPAGLEFLREVCRAVAIPVIAIGGVTPENAGSCLNMGAAGVAVLSPIMRSEDPGLKARAYRGALDSAAGSGVIKVSQ